MGLQLGIARAVGAIAFSVVIGLLMHLIFRKEEQAKAKAAAVLPEAETQRPLMHNVLYFASMVAVLIFANWGKPEAQEGVWHFFYAWKWAFTAVAASSLGVMLVAWFQVRWWKMLIVAITVTAAILARPHEPIISFAIGMLGLSILTNTENEEMRSWFSASWTFAKQIMPLLLLGVLMAGFLLGRPGEEGLIPSSWVASMVGGNSLGANLFASVAGAFMYFATLTEVPILQGLIGNGMGQGPALALLLAGPALSLPSMLVLRGVLGTKKTVVYVSLVIIMATISGMIFGYAVG